MSTIDEIIEHERLADLRQSEADMHRWEAARLIYEELQTGKSQRQLARELTERGYRCSLTHVNYMNQVWTVHLGEQTEELPKFNAAYQAAKKPKRSIPPPEKQPARDRKDPRPPRESEADEFKRRTDYEDSTEPWQEEEASQEEKDEYDRVREKIRRHDAYLAYERAQASIDDTPNAVQVVITELLQVFAEINNYPEIAEHLDLENLEIALDTMSSVQDNLRIAKKNLLRLKGITEYEHGTVHGYSERIQAGRVIEGRCEGREVPSDDSIT